MPYINASLASSPALFSRVIHPSHTHIITGAQTHTQTHTHTHTHTRVHTHTHTHTRTHRMRIGCPQTPRQGEWEGGAHAAAQHECRRASRATPHALQTRASRALQTRASRATPHAFEVLPLQHLLRWHMRGQLGAGVGAGVQWVPEAVPEEWGGMPRGLWSRGGGEVHAHKGVSVHERQGQGGGDVA